MKIKHLQTLKEPRLRHYDGETLTHALHLTLTTDEAVTVSSMFDHAVQTSDGSTPRTSLIRAAIMILAEQRLDEDFVVEALKRHHILAELAKTLALNEVQKALHLLAESNKPKQQKSQSAKQAEPKPSVNPERRVFIPDPPRRKIIR